MLAKISGEIIRVWKSKNNRVGLQLIVPRGDGQKESFTLFTSRDGFKVGDVFEGNVELFARIGSDIEPF